MIRLYDGLPHSLEEERGGSSSAEMELSWRQIKKETLQNSVLPFVQNEKVSSQTHVLVYV